MIGILLPRTTPAPVIGTRDTVHAGKEVNMTCYSFEHVGLSIVSSVVSDGTDKYLISVSISAGVWQAAGYSCV